MYEKSEYEKWSTNYDEYVKGVDKNGKYPFAGYESVLLTIFKTINTFDKEASILDLACGTGCLEELFNDGNHKITAVDFSPKMIEFAQNKNPNVEFINADLMSEELFQKLGGRKFKVIISTFFFHHLETVQRKELINRLINENLEDDGLFFIGDTMFSSLQAKELVKNNNLDHWNDHNYIVYDTFKEDFPHAVFQQVSFCTGVIAFKHQKVEQKEVKKEENSNDTNSDEIKEESSNEEVENLESNEFNETENDQSSNENNNQFVVYSDEEVESWKRVRDIPGDSIYEFGLNFIRAITPYEKEAFANWKYIGQQLKNAYGGTFTNGDIFNFRYQSINILVSSNMQLPSDEKEFKLIAGLLASSYLHNRFPSSKIGLNLYGLYFGLIVDIESILKRIYDDYNNDLVAIRNDLKNIQDTKLSSDLSYGLRK